jgi:hypothetical protein
MSILSELIEHYDRCANQGDIDMCWEEWQTLKSAVLAQQTTNNASAEILPQIDKILWGSGDSITKVAKCKDLLAKLRT